ncbi:CDP-glycerol glycerophosphotransferase family protein [Alkalihalophilus sp. As8PL]|uniref:CDP-glycerol glycerophosphotransferase family protein n=1 Tax=Alkalihalophilus sp. As8PL TaxID=3237103 RepID=A0AB39BQQ1_9BACI
MIGKVVKIGKRKSKTAFNLLRKFIVRRRNNNVFYLNTFADTNEGFTLSGEINSIPKIIKKAPIEQHSYMEIRSMADSNITYTTPLNLDLLSDGKKRKLEFSCLLPPTGLVDWQNSIKWALYIVLSDGNKETQYRMKPAKSMLHSFIIHSHFKDGLTFEPYETVAGNLSIKVQPVSALDSLSIYPHYLEDVQLTNNGYHLSGVASKDLLTKLQVDEYGLLLKKRNGHFTRKFPIAWTQENTWETNVTFEDIPTDNGIWDAYFFIESEGIIKKYRMKTTIILRLKDAIQYKQDGIKGTLSTMPYTTKKASFSIKLKTETIKLYQLSTVRNEKEMIISGSIQNCDHLEKNYNLVFRERNSNIRSEFSLKAWVDPEHPKRMYFEGTINETILLQTIQGGRSRYDVYLAGEKDGEYRTLRIRTGLNELKEKTKKEHLSEYGFFHSYFYSTVNNRLSFAYKEPTLMRNLYDFKISEGKLSLNGFAYLEGLQNEEPSDQMIFIVAKSRETEDEIVFSTKQRQSLIKRKGSGKWSDFTTAISMKDLLQVYSNGKDIIDLYVRIESPKITRDRKLGKETFTYYKDEILDSHLLKGTSSSVGFYMTYTPRGNLKIETYDYKNTHLEQLEKLNTEWSLDRDREIWIIGERPDTAQDTGYHFFKYCREKHPEVDVYYAIDREAQDVKNIKHLGNVLFIGSDEHVEKSLQATAFFGSHDLDYLLPFKGILMKSYREGLRVFLQHGVLGRKSVEYHKEYYKHPFHIFIVSSVEEKEMVMDVMGYNAEEVRVTGLSRFDNLLKNHHPEKKILLIPTWREWLNSEEEFLRSDYYHRYLAIMKDNTLRDLLEKNNMWLEFYPHYRMQPYIHEFKKNESDAIRVIQLGEQNVQDLLKSSQMMITDFSSVSFDFTYMSKPVIYYHFDQESFFKNGILRPLDETFLGDIVNNQESLVESIKKYIERDFKEEEWVQSKKPSIFTYTDLDNNKRIFELALDMKSQHKKIKEVN